MATNYIVGPSMSINECYIMESLVSKFSQRGPNHELVVEILNFLFRAMQTFRQQLLPRKRWKDIAFTMEGFANSISRIHAILISVLR